MAKRCVQVYDIHPNGCLNGVFANDGSNNLIYNEIARKKNDDYKDVDKPNDEILGNYDCFYFDVGNSPNLCDLEIRSNGNTSQYHFEWFDKGTRKTRFKGFGWGTNFHQITIQYWP